MPKLTYIRELVKCLINKDTEDAIKTMNVIIEQGKDLDNFLWEVIKYIKDVLIYKVTSHLDLYTNEDLEFMKQLLEKTSKEQLLDLIYELSELANNMKISTQKNIIFQAGILKQMSEVRVQVSKPVNHNTESGNQEIGVRPPKMEVRNQQPESRKQNTNVENQASTLKMQTSGECVPYWQNVLDKIKQAGKMTIYANLIGTRGVLVNDMVVGIEFPKKVTEFAKKVLEEHENKTFIEKIVSMEQGANMQIRILDKSNNQSTPKKQSIENIANELDIPINIIDE